MPSLRLATENDADAIARLMTAFNAEYDSAGGLPSSPANSGLARSSGGNLVTPEQARARVVAMAATEQVLLAEEAGVAVGLASIRIQPYLSEDAPCGELAELYVVPAVRRSRIAMLLLAEAERIARDRGVTQVHISTSRKNTGAQAFYAAMGYEPREVGFDKVLPPKRSAKHRRAEG